MQKVNAFDLILSGVGALCVREMTQESNSK